MKLDYACRVLAKSGEPHSGDAVFARVGPGSALFVLLDGLGHGAAAFAVAERGLLALADLPPEADAVAALCALDVRLHGTRGAAATACSLSGPAAQIVGVGNVACRTIGFHHSFVPKPGILGRRNQLPSATHLTLMEGHGLVLHSDGVSHRFDPQEIIALSPESACEYILRRHRHQHDDASVLVITAPNGSSS